MSFTPTLKKTLAAAAAAAFALTLGACGSGTGTAATPSAGSSTPAAEAGTWPRTIDTENGPLTLDKAPERIVSTTISTTGSLLAINAPVVATSLSTPDSTTIDKDGFFAQWGDVARERQVEGIYQVGAFDLESVIAQDPDLIVVSTSGADAALDHLKELEEVAPTLVVNYGNQTWQDLATELGEATGHEAEAKTAVAEFNQHVKDTAAKISVPAGTTASIVSFNAGDVSPVGKPTGPHAMLLTELGFTIEEPPAEFDTSTQKREDFSFTSYEGLAESLTGDHIFMISTDETGVANLKADKTLANAPAIKSGKVSTLGPTSFRLDYYSATGIVDWFGSSFTQ